MNEFVIPGTLIKREQYISRIIPFIGKRLIKAFTGQRRVGKSYILFQLIQLIRDQEPDAPVIYINKEDLVFDAIRTASDLSAYVLSHVVANRMNYVFIDEIQEIAEFEKALRSLLLNENIDIYCTGSNAKLLSGELATLLSGRFVGIMVHSLSYPEFLLFHKLTDSDISLDKYFKYGGLPYLIHLPLEDEVVFEYLKNIYSTIVFRDVIDRYGVRNIRFLEKLVLFLADNTGSLFSAKRISDFLKSQQIKIASNQIQVYIDYLANAFLIHRVERYDIVGKRLFEIGEKYYFENLGIRHAIWGYKPQDMGKILENAVYNQLLFKGWAITTGSLNTEEIDFVCEKDGEKMYVQVALRMTDENTIQREFGNLLKIEDNYSKKVITMDAFSGNTFQGIEHIHIRDFLLQ
ncbi:MAG: ATP-binding protein [bacterium]|nr:ATP-binding protein [bacterium]